MNNKKIVNKKGSILVFSLFIMMISLVIGVSLMSTSVIGRKSTLSSAKSVNSFQVADSGIEYAYDEIRRYRWTRPMHDLVLSGGDSLTAVFGSACNNEPTPPSAVVTGTANGGTFKLYFYSGPGGATIINPCSRDLVLITKIKSVGTYNGITRSVETDVNMSTL